MNFLIKFTADTYYCLDMYQQESSHLLLVLPSTVGESPGDSYGSEEYKGV